MDKIFTQITNQEKDIIAIAAGYQTKIDHDYWLPDGLQKDAIQNSWDARADKISGKGWQCGFYSKKIGEKDIFCIIDEGTTGLNGTKFSTKEELFEILNNNKPGEDLAYFLNSNWSAKSSEEGGNRGRGKTLFLIASRDRKIFFDSLRSSDREYVCGELYLDKDKQVKFRLFYGEAGKMFFKDLTGGNIPPLTSCGTRVFILNPEPIINEALRNGEMLSLINYTRWETIKKYNAKIYIDDGTEKRYANLPKWYEDKTDSFEKIFPSEKIKENTPYKINKIVFRYSPDYEVPEMIKGVAIQRGLMTIQRLSGEELVHEVGANNIYGWVEMEGILETEMKTMCEGPEHFDFNWTARPAKYLKDYIRLKMREFAKELKIIESEEAKKNKIQKTAEAGASANLKPLFKKLGLSGKYTGKKSRKPHKRGEDEILRLSIPDIKFPRENNKRVNYGEKIEGTYVMPINDSKDSILVLVRVFIVSDEGKSQLIEEKEIDLHSGRGPKIGSENILIDNNYASGGYSLRARMVALEEKPWILLDGTKIEKGTILYDRINQKFYVEADPPESGPFHFQPEKKTNKDALLRWEPYGDNGYLIFYNEVHPRIKIIGEDVEKLTDYLTEQGAIIALQIKLEELLAENDKSDQDFNSLIKSKDISRVVPLFLRKYSEFLWELKEKNGN